MGTKLNNYFVLHAVMMTWKKATLAVIVTLRFTPRRRWAVENSDGERVHSYIKTFLCCISLNLPEEISLAKSMLEISFNLSFIHYTWMYSSCCCSCRNVSIWSRFLIFVWFAVSTQAVKQNPTSTSSDKATPSRSGPVKKENIGAQYRHHPLRARRRPPKGMHLEQGDITSLSASHDAGVLTVRQLDTQLVSLKRQVWTLCLLWL